jgi:hypothetical protein
VTLAAAIAGVWWWASSQPPIEPIPLPMQPAPLVPATPRRPLHMSAPKHEDDGATPDAGPRGR